MKSDDEIIRDFMEYRQEHMGELKYSTNWDWLMQVVIKINNLPGWNVSINFDTSVIYDDNYKFTAQGKIFSEYATNNRFNINQVYKTILKFIKYYDSINRKV